MSYNYATLRGKIREKFGTEAEFARKMNISAVSLSSKLNNKKAFTQPEMDKAIELLGIDRNRIADCFFQPKVQNF